VSEIPAFIAMADILVSPRIFGTNIPLKIYTYLKSGKPIIATNIMAHTQVLDKKVSILAEPDPKSFAKEIIRLFEDKEFGEKIGREGKKLADAKYSYDNFLSKTRQVCEYISTLIAGK